MAKAQESVVVGWEDVVKRLKALPERLRKKALKRAMSAGARVVRDQARANVPVRTGSLKRKIVVISKRGEAGTVRAAVGIAKGKFYVRDTGQLDKKVRAGRTYRVKIKGQAARLVKVHPRRYAHLVEFGSKNNPPAAFMRNAARAKAPAVFAAVEKSVRASLEKEGVR